VPGLAFGYEEAIGYCTDPEAVADKDGITTLVRILDLAARLKDAGSSVAERLDDIATRFGVHHTSQLAFRVGDLGLIGEAMARIRAVPPTTLAGDPVTVANLADGWAGLPPTDGLLFEGGTVRAVVRPSGTEPKLKCYLQVKRPAGGDLASERRNAATLMAAARAELTVALGL